MENFGELDVTDWEYRDQEPKGKSVKEWYRSPFDQKLWLFKPAGKLAANVPDGKDWAEKVSAELGLALGVPVATVELAVRRGSRGSISRNVNTYSFPTRSGALLLSGIDPEFDQRAKQSIGHSLERIHKLLSELQPPATFSGPDDMSAFDVFCGYLALDALIANRDRHSENWSTLIDSSRVHRLMESYDHGSSLGFNQSEERCEAMISDSGRLASFVNRGTAYRFESHKHTTLVNVVPIAMSMTTPTTRMYWLERIEALSAAQIDNIVSSTPRMSAVTTRFVIALVKETRRRLIDGLH